MGRLIKPRINRIFATKVKQVTLDLSERSKVFAVAVTSTRCPNCIYDAVNKASTGKYRAGGPTAFTGKTCPVCKNKGDIDTETRREVKCSVQWGKDTDTAPYKKPVLLPGGSLPLGFARCKTDHTNRAVVKGASYFLVDDERCILVGVPVPRGLLNYVQYVFVVQIDK